MNWNVVIGCALLGASGLVMAYLSCLAGLLTVREGGEVMLWIAGLALVMLVGRWMCRLLSLFDVNGGWGSR